MKVKSVTSKQSPVVSEKITLTINQKLTMVQNRVMDAEKTYLNVFADHNLPKPTSTEMSAFRTKERTRITAELDKSTKIKGTRQISTNQENLINHCRKFVGFVKSIPDNRKNVKILGTVTGMKGEQIAAIHFYNAEKTKEELAKWDTKKPRKAKKVSTKKAKK